MSYTCQLISNGIAAILGAKGIGDLAIATTNNAIHGGVTIHVSKGRELLGTIELTDVELNTSVYRQLIVDGANRIAAARRTWPSLTTCTYKA